MAVYYIGSYDLTDSQTYDQYVQRVIPLLMKHGCEIVAADRQTKAIEGKPRKINLILRFESEAKAMNWYNDPDYQSVKALRLASTTNGTGVIVKGFEMPKA